MTYRDRLPVNDAQIARVGYVADGDRDVYSAALVNPRYPVAVARFHVQLFGAAQCEVYLRASMGGTSRESRRWILSGKTAPNEWAWHILEVAWLHGMPLDEWRDTEVVSATRRGNIEFHWKVTQNQEWFARNPDLRTDLQNQGFTAAQANTLALWFQTFPAQISNYFREPEYAFLAPMNAFPSASAEGTLLAGSRIDVRPT
ncbi:hypothetical protein JOD54_001096 [Actinokineospora baliensis]|uniref:hypothetical protein n=1 Tax=Actinokineospora baliensis TaxID=547056 RepID=UPI0019567B9B|nr:hypothetical protein [Actinokineospora baliensis]MBM7770892.1 hypothetical protein [Actinokineospora baliensis]